MADGIDFRFEDWGQGFNPDRQGAFLRVPPTGADQFFSGSFSAPLKDGTFLNVNLGGRPAPSAGGPALALATQKKVSIESRAAFKPLPAQWFEFAILYLGNKVVKPPEWPRCPSEGGKMAEWE